MIILAGAAVVFYLLVKNTAQKTDQTKVYAAHQYPPVWQGLPQGYNYA